jgi:hypothetical protein
MASAAVLEWFRKTSHAWVAVIAAGVFAHGILIFTDHVIWDGWWFNRYLGAADAGVLDRQLIESGKPLEKIFLSPFRLISSFDGRVSASKVLSVAAWIASFAAAWWCLKAVAGVPPPIATAISALAAASPFYDVLGDLSLWMHVSCVLLFWLAWAAMALGRDLRGLRYIVIRSIALAIFFVSFNLNSLLVFFYSVASCLLILRKRGEQALNICPEILRVVPRWLDFAVLPIVFWLWKTTFTPTSGYYENYNKPNLQVSSMIEGMGSVVWTFLGPTAAELFFPLDWTVLGALIGGLGGWWCTQHAVAIRADVDFGNKFPLRLAVCGAVLLVGALFPYVVVGQPITSYGWWSRNTILLPLPLATLCVAGVMSVSSRLRLQSRTCFVAIAVLVGIFASAAVRNYLLMQGYGAKQIAIQSRLCGLISDSSPVLIQLRDYFAMPGANDGYPPAIWTFIASDLNKKPRTFVVDTRQIVPDLLQRDIDGRQIISLGVASVDRQALDTAIHSTGVAYAFDDIPRTGCQMLLVIQQGLHGADGRRIGMQYLQRRWLAPLSLEQFVAELVIAHPHALPPVAE